MKNSIDVNASVSVKLEMFSSLNIAAGYHPPDPRHDTVPLQDDVSFFNKK